MIKNRLTESDAGLQLATGVFLLAEWAWIVAAYLV